MPQLTGRATITWNGQTLDTKNGASLDPGGITRETQTGDQSIHFSEALRPAMVKCEVNWTPDLSLRALNDIRDATIQFSCDTGALYVIRQAWRTGELEAKAAKDGGISITFEGPEAEEVLGA